MTPAKNSGKVIATVGGLGVLAGLVYLATRAKAVPPGRANLYGKVTGAVTGNPIPGVLVSLNGMETLTDDSGDYIFGDLAPGEYILQFSKDGYETAVY